MLKPTSVQCPNFNIWGTFSAASGAGPSGKLFKARHNLTSRRRYVYTAQRGILQARRGRGLGEIWLLQSARFSTYFFLVEPSLIKKLRIEWIKFKNSQAINRWSIYYYRKCKAQCWRGFPFLTHFQCTRNPSARQMNVPYSSASNFWACWKKSARTSSSMQCLVHTRVFRQRGLEVVSLLQQCRLAGWSAVHRLVISCMYTHTHTQARASKEAKCRSLIKLTFRHVATWVQITGRVLSDVSTETEL